MVSSSELLSAEQRQQFSPAGTFLNTASYGLLARNVVARTNELLEARRAGRFDIVGLDVTINRCREIFARLVGRRTDQIAISSQASQMVGLVANSLPAGTRVVLPEGEFNSVLWPFLARHSAGGYMQVTTVPPEGLADAVTDETDLVAASLVQSADGRVLDGPAIVDAARRHGARVLFDVTQAAGWYPVHDTGADWVVSVGYKWLLGPKGVVFLAGSDEALEDLRPLAASWYSGYDPWDTIYGGPLRLAEDARRFDISPTWEAWPGQLVGLELIESLGIDAIHRHDVALANRLLAGLGRPESNSAIVSLDVGPDAEARLDAAGVVGATRAGRLRLSFHLYNTSDDVEHALKALSGIPG